MAKVADLMDSHVVGVSVGTAIGSARKLMAAMHVGLMPVVDNGVLKGIVISSDLESMDAMESVRSVMRRPVFMQADDDAEAAVAKMVENSLERLPVVNSRIGMKCVGTISATDLVRHVK